MAHIKAYKKYYGKLILLLPMDDDHFIADLFRQDLLSLKTMSELKALPQAEKASYFLDHVIESALDTNNFDNLLSVMEHCEYGHVVKLACKIKSEIDETSDTKSGMDIRTYMYVLGCIV